MAVKVSVVIPVFNPGPYVESCIEGLLRQSMPQDEFEAIFVDDGSTDETPDRLDRLAAEHPNMRVIHQPNSGWPGKPRNVGIDAARGEYIQFVDNDDWLGDEALERLYDFAKANDSDLVIGKMAGIRRGVPKELFRKTSPKTTLMDAPVMYSMTPHKFFRKAMLDEHGIRFPEGKRRLEDHVFVTASYFAAKTISVYSDYVCYYHIRRPDDSNAGFGALDWKGYFNNLREAIDIVMKNTEPGALRDRFFRRWARIEMVQRLRGNAFLKCPEDERRYRFDEIRGVMNEYFGAGVYENLPPINRAIVERTMAGDYDGVVEIAEFEAGLTLVPKLEDMKWSDELLVLDLTAEIATAKMSDSATAKVSDSAIGSPYDLDLRFEKLDIVLRNRDTWTDLYQATDVTLDGLTARLAARIDARTLDKGAWDVLARGSAGGWVKDIKLGALRTPAATDHRTAGIIGSPPRMVVPYWVLEKDYLTLDVGQKWKRLDPDLLDDGAAVTFGRRAIDVRLPLRVTAGVPTASVVRLKREGAKKPVDVKATPSTDARGRLVLTASVPRQKVPAGSKWSVEVRLVEFDTASAEAGTKRSTEASTQAGTEATTNQGAEAGTKQSTEAGAQASTGAGTDAPKKARFAKLGYEFEVPVTLRNRVGRLVRGARRKLGLR